MELQKGLISIVIPVYNSGERLRECLESVLVQSYKSLEVIIVDDCSTDGSLSLCQAYEEKYPFIRVYTKENEGVSAARNYGMERASGEFLQFLDSDDMLYPEACQTLVSALEENQNDVVICGYFNEKEQKKQVYRDCIFTEKGQFLDEFGELFTNYFIHVPWNKLYRRSAVDSKFPLGLSKGEDLIFNLGVLQGVERIRIIPDALYFYHNVNDNSLSFRYREDAMEIEERLYREVSDYYKKMTDGKEPEFMYSFFLTAVKNKLYALVGKSNLSRHEKIKKIAEWTRRESICSLCKKKHHFEKKDRILLMLMQHRMAGLLYMYYRIAA